MKTRCEITESAAWTAAQAVVGTAVETAVETAAEPPGSMSRAAHPAHRARR
ncbi:hypothetical protein PSP6_100006 [Paraburkholderia tropica]|nr:hypothetical protein PSP6_100006 [Paraburkholderia tropica]